MSNVYFKSSGGCDKELKAEQMATEPLYLEGAAGGEHSQPPADKQNQGWP